MRPMSAGRMFATRAELKLFSLIWPTALPSVRLQETLKPALTRPRLRA
jgi:hypothetical protein